MHYQYLICALSLDSQSPVIFKSLYVAESDFARAVAPMMSAANTKINKIFALHIFSFLSPIWAGEIAKQEFQNNLA